MADANWYPDPDVPGQLRYFDGTQWTEHRASAAPVAAAAPLPAAHAPASRAFQTPVSPITGDPRGVAPTAVAFALLAAGAYVGLGSAAGEDLPGWDGFEETSLAVGGALLGALLGVAVGLAATGDRGRAILLAAVLGAAGGGALGWLQFDLFEALDVDEPGVAAVVPQAFLGAAIGAGVGLGAAGARGLGGGLVGGAVASAVTASMSGFLSEDVTVLGLPLQGLQFETDLGKSLAGIALLLAGTAAGISVATARRSAGPSAG
jgi:hypothetical protein